MPRKLPIVLTLCALLTVATCNRAKPLASPATTQSGLQRYALKGKVVTVDKNAGTADIDNQTIPDFMDEMVMPYTFKPATQIGGLTPGDSITADMVVAEPGKYWLENVRVTAHSAQPAR
jgi:Cu/Ag efflux protein CusF